MTGVTAAPRPAGDTGRLSGGLLFGLGAYGLWGVFPAFFDLLSPAGAVEILAHRVLWTVMFMALLLMAVGRVGDLRAITPRTWLLLAFASALISANWLIYIYAVNADHVVDAALGYFITPLVSVVLGIAVFGERLNRAQGVALLIAASAVVLLSTAASGKPLIGIGLAVSFGIYGAVKKVVPTDPRVSLSVETAIAAPFAVAYLVVHQIGGNSEFLANGIGHAALMILCGPVTAIQLLFFGAAAQRLPLVTLGLLQYTTPSLQLAWGILAGHEPMPPARWIGFALIWIALAIFSADALSRAYRARTGTLHPS